ncbi:D-glycero-alpha-D-manno-heptose-1,7-bisphosphate 7-phosphatase [bacterium RCC_150]
MEAAITTPVRAILFDRDGTLVEDVPYNSDPAMVRPMKGAKSALQLVRASGVATGVVSNQSGVGRGILSQDELDRVNARVDALLGPFDVWEICPHAPEDGCDCRKPAPGMIRSACRKLGVACSEVVYIGDIGSDVEAAGSAGARSVLVPTPVTRSEEVQAAPVVAEDLLQAVQLVLGQAS